MTRKRLKSNPARQEALERHRKLEEARLAAGTRGSNKYQQLLTEDPEVNPMDVPPHEPAGARGGKEPAIADPAVRALIVDLIRNGNYPQTAAAFAGISFEQFKIALEKGRSGKDLLYYEFWKDICKAEAEAEIGRLQNISKHAEDDWKAELELMSRRWPERWGNKTARLEISGSVEHNIRNEFAAQILEDPVSRQLARQLLSRQEETIDGEYTEISSTG